MGYTKTYTVVLVIPRLGYFWVFVVVWHAQEKGHRCLNWNKSSSFTTLKPVTFSALLLQQKSTIVQQFLTSLRHIAFYGFSNDFIFTGQSDAWYPALELASVLPDSVSVDRRPGPSGCASVPASWACALPRNSSQCTERRSTPSRNAGHTILTF